MNPTEKDIKITVTDRNNNKRTAYFGIREDFGIMTFKCVLVLFEADGGTVLNWQELDALMDPTSYDDEEKLIMRKLENAANKFNKAIDDHYGSAIVEAGEFDNPRTEEIYQMVMDRFGFDVNTEKFITKE